MTTKAEPTPIHGRSHRKPVTKKMRAVVQDRYGSSDTLTLSTVDRPDIASDEVLIEVVGAGVDRGVWHLLTGKPYLIRLMGYGFAKPKVRVPGADVAGRVAVVGDEVTRFQVGDEVFEIAKGAYAEYAAAKEDSLVHKPSDLTFEQGAVVSISGITALQALTDVGQIEPGQSVLVIGASGGVGTYAVQLARALGATVTGVSSAAKADLVRSLGADHTIDYDADTYLDSSTQFDLIIDIGGRNPVTRLRKAVKSDGTLVIVGGEGGGSLTGGIGRQIWAKLLSPFVSQRLTFFISEEHHRHIERLAEYLETGEVVPAVGKKYSLDDAPEAIADLEAGRARGKSVIVVGQVS